MDEKLLKIKELFNDDRLQRAHNLISELKTAYDPALVPEISIIQEDLALANDCLELLADLDS